MKNNSPFWTIAWLPTQFSPCPQRLVCSCGKCFAASRWTWFSLFLVIACVSCGSEGSTWGAAAQLGQEGGDEARGEWQTGVLNMVVVVMVLAIIISLSLFSSDPLLSLNEEKKTKFLFSSLPCRPHIHLSFLMTSFFLHLVLIFFLDRGYRDEGSLRRHWPKWCNAKFITVICKKKNNKPVS